MTTWEYRFQPLCQESQRLCWVN